MRRRKRKKEKEKIKKRRKKEKENEKDRQREREVIDDTTSKKGCDKCGMKGRVIRLKGRD